MCELTVEVVDEVCKYEGGRPNLKVPGSSIKQAIKKNVRISNPIE